MPSTYEFRGHSETVAPGNRSSWYDLNMGYIWGSGMRKGLKGQQRETFGLMATGFLDGSQVDECLTLWRLGGARPEDGHTVERENRGSWARRQGGGVGWGGQSGVLFLMARSAMATGLGSAVGAGKARFSAGELTW